MQLQKGGATREGAGRALLDALMTSLRSLASVLVMMCQKVGPTANLPTHKSSRYKPQQEAYLPHFSELLGGRVSNVARPHPSHSVQSLNLQHITASQPVLCRSLSCLLWLQPAVKLHLSLLALLRQQADICQIRFQQNTLDPDSGSCVEPGQL